MNTILELSNVLDDELISYAFYGKGGCSNLFANYIRVLDSVGMKDNRIEIELHPTMKVDIDKYKRGEMDDDSIYMLLTKRQARILGEFLISVSEGEFDGEQQ